MGVVTGLWAHVASASSMGASVGAIVNLRPDGSATSELEEFVPVEGLASLAKGSVSLFINHFKGHVTKLCKKNGFDNFQWQSRFNDRIIRDQKEYENIAAYINSNVINWLP